MTGLQITYRRRGGLFALVAIATVAGAAMLVLVTFTALAVAVVGGGAGLMLARVFRWTPWACSPDVRSKTAPGGKIR